MLTPASIAKHPIHPMLITIPIGLWIFSFACDLIRYFGGTSPNWPVVALYAMVGGIIGALLAALPGLIDLLSLPSGIRRIALLHMGINLTVVALYVINAWWRMRGAGAGALVLSAIAIGLLVVSGWLGGKMVHVHGVGVQTPPAPLR
ncbi:MAG: DUF2231 domain-containing protein [Cupriavidus sp.]|nr:DUF2231 domain-containing protein [Cupriavidus sp.]NUT15332.1 DUF2231 domain-containing protein [Cupriavidus sp.]